MGSDNPERKTLTVEIFLNISRHNPDMTYGDFIFLTAGKTMTQVCSEEEEDLQCSVRQKFVAGNVQSPGRVCFSQAGRQANHQSRLLLINVTTFHIKHSKNIKLILITVPATVAPFFPFSTQYSD